MSGHLEQRLDDEHAEDELVQPEQERAVPLNHGRTGLQAGHHPGE